MRVLLVSLLERITLSGSLEDAAADAERDLHMATALLLVEVGRADFAWAEDEIDMVINRICILFDLDRETAEALFAEAHEQSEHQVSLHPVLRTLNERCSQAQKVRVLTDCWRVAYADGALDRYEEHQIRKIADWLYLPHAEFIKAKLKAAAEAKLSWPGNFVN